jgi:hypothetical protein
MVAWASAQANRETSWTAAAPTLLQSGSCSRSTPSRIRDGNVRTYLLDFKGHRGFVPQLSHHHCDTQVRTSVVAAFDGHKAFFHRPSLTPQNEKGEKGEKGEKENFSRLKIKRLEVKTECAKLAERQKVWHFATLCPLPSGGRSL